MRNALKAFGSLPRAARWAALAAMVFAGYFLIVEPVLDITNRHDAGADAIESNLRRAAELADENSDDGRLLVGSMRNFGDPHLPNAPATRSESIQRIVDEVLEAHGVETRTKNERNSTLTGDRARAIAGDGEARIERFIVEVSFEADQATVARIVADLEQSPVVSAVSRVKVDRTAVGSRYADGAAAPAGKVRATINAESWVLIRSRAGSGSSGDAS